MSYCPSSYLAPCLGLLLAEGKGEVGEVHSYPTPGLVQDAADISVQTHKHRTGGTEGKSELNCATCSKARGCWEEMGKF